MKQLFLMAILATVFADSYAQDKTPVRLAQYNLSVNKLGIAGYDPVTYFSGKPKQGQKEYAVSHQGITYYFINAQNKETFQKTPAQYEPQYGGWCAYAMGSNGTKVDVDPETYKILDGKLYLFYNSFFNNTLKSWNKDEPALRKGADASWSKFYQ